MVGIAISRANWSKASWVAAAALSCGGMVLPAWSSPPFSRHAASPASSHPRHLDLRPPSARELGDFSAVPADRSFGGRPPTPGLQVPGSRDSNLPGLGAGESRVMGRAETFVRSFHREGLPVARLWENHSALLSLGLNGKGKPGLWLVQKTH
jgi:hypothetical protein